MTIYGLVTFIEKKAYANKLYANNRGIYYLFHF